MVIVLVESAHKARLIKGYIETRPELAEFECYFTAGRIFDWSLGMSGESWKPINREIYDFLKSKIKNADTIIAMTDGDEQGEYIAFQIAILGNGKNVAKADLKLVTPDGVINALKHTRSIDYRIVTQCLSERLINLDIAELGVKQKVGGVSLHSMLLALKVREKGESIISLSTPVSINGQSYSVTLLHEKQSGEVDINLIKPTAPNYMDVLSDTIICGNANALNIANEMQSLYEDGILSYARTSNNQWHSNASTFISELIEHNGMVFDPDRFNSNVTNDNTHSALYLCEPERAVGLPSIRAITNRTLATVSKGNSTIAPKILACSGDVNHVAIPTSKISKECSLIATPACQALYWLTKENLVKPSTLASHINKAEKNIWLNNGELNHGYIDKVCKHANNNYPNLENNKDLLNHYMMTINENPNNETSNILDASKNIANLAIESIAR